MPPEIAPQTTQLKDALRALRYSLRKGRDTVRLSAPRSLPPPVSGIALSALDQIEVLARGVDHFACDVAHTVLGNTVPKSASLSEIAASSNPELEFSAAYYEVMKLVLRRLGAERALVYQSAARRAFARFSGAHDVFELAAQLTLHLADNESIIVDRTDERSPVDRSEVAAVAAFAGLLSLLADSNNANRDEVIFAATDLAAAFRKQISELRRKKDISAMAALFRRCAPHV